MENRNLADILDMRQNESVEFNQVGDNRGEGNELAIERGTVAASLGKLVEGTNQEGLRLAAVKLEIV